jgi:hypothetical protein
LATPELQAAGLRGQWAGEGFCWMTVLKALPRQMVFPLGFLDHLHPFLGDFHPLVMPRTTQRLLRRGV